MYKYMNAWTRFEKKSDGNLGNRVEHVSDLRHDTEIDAAMNASAEEPQQGDGVRWHHTVIKKYIERRTIIDDMHSPWGGYHDNSFGRAQHYLYVVTRDLNLCEQVTFCSDGKIQSPYQKTPIAHITFDQGFPYLHFVNNPQLDGVFLGLMCADDLYQFTKKRVAANV